MVCAVFTARGAGIFPRASRIVAKGDWPQLACIACHRLHPNAAKWACLNFWLIRNAPCRPLIHLGILTGRPLRKALLGGARVRSMVGSIHQRAGPPSGGPAK
jgi:hypothetical protein